MRNESPKRKLSSRSKWLLIALMALLAPALFLLPRGGAQERDPNRPAPDVVRMIGPISQDKDLRDLPYIPPTPGEPEGRFLMRHPPKEQPTDGRSLRGPRFSAREAERDIERMAEEEVRREADLVKQQKRKSPKTPKALSTVRSRRTSTSPNANGPRRSSDRASNDGGLLPRTSRTTSAIAIPGARATVGYGLKMMSSSLPAKRHIRRTISRFTGASSGRSLRFVISW